MLNSLTGEEWVSLRDRYRMLPTPLERIEDLLSMLIHIVANFGAKDPPEYKGSKIPERRDMILSVLKKKRKADEQAIIANMMLHMLVHNSSRGAEWGSQLKPAS